MSEIALEALTNSLGRAEALKVLRETAKARGLQMVGYLASSGGPGSWTPEVFACTFVQGGIRNMGVDVEVLNQDETRVRYRMFDCPFQELAQQDNDLVCDNLDAGFYEGVLEALGGGLGFRRFACIGHGDAFCEYEFNWPAGESGGEMGTSLPEENLEGE
jgi:predicted hydrocarbon binding protein